MANTVATLRAQVTSALAEVRASLENGFATAVPATEEFRSYQTVIVEVRDLQAQALGYVGAPTPAAVDAIALFASAARTTAQDSDDQVNAKRFGLVLVVNVTAYTAGGLTPSLNKKNEDGTYTALLTGTKITATGRYVYLLDAGVGNNVVAGFANVSAKPLPQTWRASLAVDDATSITYSVTAYPF